MYRYKSDEEIINEAKTLVAVHKYYGNDDKDKFAKIIDLIDDLANRLDTTIKRNHYRPYFVERPVEPLKSTAATKDDLEEVETRLKDEIDQNWHELKDMIDALSETGKQEDK